MMKKETARKIKLLKAYLRLFATIMLSLWSAYYLLQFLVHENIVHGLTAIIFILLLKDEK